MKTWNVFPAAFLILVCALGVAPTRLHAQNTDTENLERAHVVSATVSVSTLVPGTDTPQETQTITAEVVSGPEKGTRATFENDYTQLRAGDVFYVRHIKSVSDGTDMWSVADPYRLPVLLGLALVFLLLTALFGGLPGVRGVASLAGSIVLIFYVLLPGIYHGYSPVLVCLGVASLIIIVGSYITHGFTRTTSVAVVSMILTLLVTGAGAYYVVHAARLSGFTSENNAYLNFATGGRISMVGLLFGGIMIGLLGVLYDIAIGQAIAVEELLRAGSHYSRKEVFLRALRIGREHIGALVNTLAIAYVGASLPLLLLFKNATTGPLYIINSELFATEIVRILIGSIGLVLAVPITTLLASRVLRRDGTSSTSSHTH